MSPNRHHSTVIEFPSELVVRMTREFDAPMQLVFDAFTKPELVRQTFAPFGETMTVCEIDLRVGGTYHFVMVTKDGYECSFPGTFLFVEPPTRSVQTWRFDGWPDVEAVETLNLHETDGVTTLTYELAFADKAGRDHMAKFDGHQANFDNIDDLFQRLLASPDTD
ncbi:MAG: SRPBCC domain-containing protein [Acidimicrobiales bacterium]